MRSARFPRAPAGELTCARSPRLSQVPLREIDYLPSWETALRSGNYRMASFSLVLGSTSALMAGRVCLPSSKANPVNACFAFPGWEEWLPLLGSQCGAYMAAFRQAVENLVSPTASAPATYRASRRPDQSVAAHSR